jgi:tRNA (guanine37-N1)-methyltransferase
MPEPVYNAVKSINAPEGTPVVFLTPAGAVFTQKKAREMAGNFTEIILLCGHYEGIDQRVLDQLVTHQISIGDYILTGGEIAALAVIDAVARLVPGVLGKAESHENESFSGVFDGLVEHPHYTRPAVWQGKEVPPILMSGNHAKIDEYRMNEAIKRTTARAKLSAEGADSPAQG